MSRASRLPTVFLLVVLPLFFAMASAQGADPAIAPTVLASLAAQTAKRFPQPVRVGDLIGRQVLEPTESQQVLGYVTAIVHAASLGAGGGGAGGGDSGLEAIVRYGGFFGFGGHPIAVPIDALALLGEYVVATGFTPAQLDAFPDAPPDAPSGAPPGAEAARGTALAPDSVIRMGIVGPYH